MADERQQVVLETKLDDTGVSAGIKALEKDVEKLQSSYNSAAKKYDQLQKKLEKTPANSALKQEASNLEKYLDKAGPELEDMKARLEKMRPLEGLSKEADDLAGQLSDIYDRMQKQISLGADPGSKAFQSMKYDAEQTAKALDEVYGKLNSIDPGIAANAEDQLKGLQQANADAIGKFTEAFTSDQNLKDLQAEIMKTADAFDELAAKQKEYQDQGVDPKTDKWKKTQSNIDATKQKLDKLIAKLRETDSASADKMQSAVKAEYRDTKNSALDYEEAARKAQEPKPGPSLPDISGKMAKNNAAFKVGLKHVLQYAFGIRSLFFIFRKLRTAMAEGLQNLAQFQGGANATNTAISSLKSSMGYLKNAWAAAFAPILSVVAPVLTTLIDLLSAAANAIARFFALLGGKSTYIKATKVQQNYAKSLAGTGGAAKKAADDEKDAAKENEKALASFDEINQLNLQKEKDSADSGGGGGGGGGISPGSMFEEASTGGASEFALKTAEKLKAIWEDLVNTAHNLGKAWKEAWAYNDNGVRITQALQGMWFDLLDNIKQITQATEDWSASLTFVPLVSAIADVLESIRPVLNDIEQLGVWIYQNVLLPIASWVIESSLPAFLEVIAATLDVIHQIVRLLAPILQAIFDNFISPIASFLGQALVVILGWIADGLEKLAEWLSLIPGLNLETATASVSTWLDASTNLQGIWDAFKGYISVGLTVMKNFFSTIWNAIKTIVTGLWNHMITDIKNTWNDFWQFIKAGLELLNEFFSVIWNAIKTVVTSLWNHMITGLQDAWNGFMAFIQPLVELLQSIFQGLMDFISGDFTSGWQSAWEGIKGIFTDVFNGIAAVCESVINGIVDALNRISFTVPDWSPFAGGKHFGFNLSRISIPRLATGTVVPPNAGEFAAILGDNRTDTEVVSPLETMKEAMLEALEESGGGQKQIVLKFDGNLAELARILKPELEQEDRRAGVQLVVEG